MLEVLAEAVPGAQVPPAIHALLTARLDQLPAQEREVLEVASAIGRDFSWAALRAMLAAEGVGDTAAQQVVARLARRRMVSRVSSDGFRFGQGLVRDTAYALSPKSRRGGGHLQLAAPRGAPPARAAAPAGPAAPGARLA